MTGTIALVLSGLAVVVSACSLAINTRTRRRDLFLSMHERLLGDDVRRGRRALLEAPIDSIEEARSFRDGRPAEYDLACRALAMFDVLGCYVQRKYVNKGLALDEWGHTYAAAWLRGRHIVGMRLSPTTTASGPRGHISSG